MKCGACKFDSDGVREEDGFIRIKVISVVHNVIGNRSTEVPLNITGTFPQHEVRDINDEVLLWMCPKCGTVRGDCWRLKN